MNLRKDSEAQKVRNPLVRLIRHNSWPPDSSFQKSEFSPVEDGYSPDTGNCNAAYCQFFKDQEAQADHATEAALFGQAAAFCIDGDSTERGVKKVEVASPPGLLDVEVARPQELKIDEVGTESVPPLAPNDVATELPPLGGNKEKKEPDVIPIKKQEFSFMDYLFEFKDYLVEYKKSTLACIEVPLILGLGFVIYIQQLNKELPKTKKEHIIACLQKTKNLIVQAVIKPRESLRLYPRFTIVVWSALIVNSALLGKVLKDTIA